MGFNEIYRAIDGSKVYREAVRASTSGLPDWLVPFSLVSGTLLERIAGLFHVENGDALLDLACGAGGPGIWVAERTGCSVVGVDSSPAAVQAATRLAGCRNMLSRVRFLVADATASGLPSRSVSAVMSIDALMFIDAAGVAKESARLLKPGGVFAATVSKSLGEPFTPTLVRDYRPIFESAGFKILLHEESKTYIEQQLALYRSLQERADALRNEIGEGAEDLLSEARDGLARTTTRVRHILMVAERTKRKTD